MEHRWEVTSPRSWEEEVIERPPSYAPTRGVSVIEFSEDLLLREFAMKFLWLCGLPVEVRPSAGELGSGVFATTEVKAGTYLGDYVGELLTFEELKERHPTLEPRYAFRVDDVYVDAEYSALNFFFF